jgi:hypothetical protein
MTRTSSFFLLDTECVPWWMLPFIILLQLRKYSQLGSFFAQGCAATTSPVEDAIGSDARAAAFQAAGWNETTEATVRQRVSRSSRQMVSASSWWFSNPYIILHHMKKCYSKVCALFCADQVPRAPVPVQEARPTPIPAVPVPTAMTRKTRRRKVQFCSTVWSSGSSTRAIHQVIDRHEQNNQQSFIFNISHRGCETWFCCWIAQSE